MSFRPLIFFISIFLLTTHIHAVSITLEDFEDNNLWTPVTSLGWWNLDEVYDYIITDQNSYKSDLALKISYQKTKPYQLFAGYIDETSPKRDFSKYDTVSVMVYGAVKILLKFEDRNSIECNVGVKTSLKTDEWNRLDFDFSHVDTVDIKNIKNIFLFFAPGDVGTKGLVYIDDIVLSNKDDKQQTTILPAIFKQRKGEKGNESQKYSAINLNCPYDFVVNQDCNLFVLQCLSGMIFQYDNNGKYVAELGRLGEAEDEFKNPVAIEINKGKNLIYVADTGKKNIHMLDFSSKTIAQTKIQGQMKDIADITMDSNDNIYILDKNENVLHCYNAEFGFKTIVTGFFLDPIQIKCFEDFIYIMDKGTFTIDKFDLAGKFILSVKCVDADGQNFIPKGLAFDKETHSCYVLADNRKSLLVYDKNWQYIGESKFFPLTSPNNIEIVQQGVAEAMVYVSDMSKGKIFFGKLMDVEAKIE